MTTHEIKDYLENYTTKKTIAEYKAQNGRASDRVVVCIRAIENCIEILPDGMGDLLRMHYMEKKSLRKIASEHYFCKDTIAKRCAEAIDLMGECLVSI